MELQEGLEFYKQCLKHCDDVLASLYASDLQERRKMTLIDKLLDTRNELTRRIEFLEELLK